MSFLFGALYNQQLGLVVDGPRGAHREFNEQGYQIHCVEQNDGTWRGWNVRDGSCVGEILMLGSVFVSLGEGFPYEGQMGSTPFLVLHLCAQNITYEAYVLPAQFARPIYGQPTITERAWSRSTSVGE